MPTHCGPTCGAPSRTGIRDELRRATFRQGVILPDGAVRASDDAPQLGQLIDDETWRRYLHALKRLPDRDRRLIVGRRNSGTTARNSRLSSACQVQP